LFTGIYTFQFNVKTITSAAARLYRVVFKSYYSNLSIQGYPIFKIAGKSKSVMGAGEPEEIGEIKKNPEVLQNIE